VAALFPTPLQVQLMKTVSSGGNATSRFLATHWATIRPHLLELLRARSLAVRESGFADDALNELVVSLIKHDRLAPYIEGEGVQLGVLSVWALQKLYGVMRSRGGGGGGGGWWGCG